MSDELKPEPTGPESWWSYGNTASVNGQPINGGMVWMELEAITMGQFLESVAYFAAPHAAGATPMLGIPPEHQAYDSLSMVGQYARSWNTVDRAVVGKRNPAGGEGSDTYELQHVGGYTGDVKISLEEPVWFFRGDEYVKEVTPRGYHEGSDGANYEGPKSGSEAAEILGSSTYYWDGDDALYRVK